jgi:hypothetical protein
VPLLPASLQQRHAIAAGGRGAPANHAPPCPTGPPTQMRPTHQVHVHDGCDKMRRNVASGQ